jgi:tRNA threonylcarbamoyl adenosine modification protein YeaZ
VLVLGFDTSTPAVTVGVAEVEKWDLPEGGWLATASEGFTLLSAHTEVATNKHGELLAPLIERALSDANANPRDLTAVGVGLGPGPFTGLRVGIVTALAMADALGIKAFGLPSLSFIGRGRRGVASNARRKQVYWGVPSGRGRFRIGPEIGTPEEAAEQFRLAGISRVAGEGPSLYPEAFAGFSSAVDDRYPRIEDLLTYVAAKLQERAEGDDLTPLYLRRPDATPPGKPKSVTPS